MRNTLSRIATSFALAMSVTVAAHAQDSYGAPPQAPPVLQPDPYAGGPYGQGYYAPVQDPNGGYGVDPSAGYANPNAMSYGSPDDASLANYDDGYDPQAASQFESSLAPYGSWMDTPSYGRVWCPSANEVGADFSPYATRGHWAYTEYGWTWVSDWDWGWAPFHYGRWVHLDSCGWSWVPGTAWGPAWVAWRSGGGYVGWAPLPPAGIGLAQGVFVGSPWRFVQTQQLGVATPVYVPPAVVPSVWSQTALVPGVRLVNIAGVSVRVPAGPVGGAFGMMRPVPLASFAPGLAPRAAIVPRVALPIGSRPWIQARVPEAAVGFGGAGPAYAAPRGYPQPSGYAPPPVYNAPRPAYAAPMYNPPAYNMPRPAYAPPPVYNAPVYNAPRPAYAAPPAFNAPMYNAPRPAYAAPPAFNAPMYNAPRPAYAAPPAFNGPRNFAPGPSFGGGGGFAAPVRPSFGGFRGGRR